MLFLRYVLVMDVMPKSGNAVLTKCKKCCSYTELKRNEEIFLAFVYFCVDMPHIQTFRWCTVYIFAGFATLGLAQQLPAGTRLTLRFTEITHANGSVFNTYCGNGCATNR